MRLLTPEIAWHETLPIYSCDLQHRITPGFGFTASADTNVMKPANRSPLADITTCAGGDGPQSEPQLAADHVGSPGWTRLATAGGDNVVRLWRVRLGWVSANAVTGGGGDIPSMGKKAVGGNNTAALANLAEHLTYLASLRRHEKPVNVVRWSPSGDYLASAGDDLFIIIWSNQTGAGASTVSDGATGLIKEGVDEDEEDEVAASAERWVPCRSLRRHLEDIYDLCWSPDNKGLISGSVDHSVIIWQLDLEPVQPPPSGSPSKAITAVTATPSNTKSTTGGEKSDSAVTTDAVGVSTVQPVAGPAGTKNLIVRDHKHYVQGVTWDPLGFYVASLSSDRACRVYRAGTRTCLAHVSKAGKQRLFQDDSWKSFFRRLSFSPDGLLLACPAGNLEEAVFAGSVAAAASLATAVPNATATTMETPAIPAVAPQHAAHIFLRSNFTRPVASLPTGPRPVVTVRFCPQPFQLRPTNLLNGQNADRRASLFDLPYRWLFCLVLEDGILFYDTQQTTPFAQVSQFHYQALNDASWSRDGHLVVVCSTDGYCSLIHFARGELGTPYHGSIGPSQTITSVPTPIAMPTDQSPTEDAVKNVVIQPTCTTIDKQNRPSPVQLDPALPSAGCEPKVVKASETCEVASLIREEVTLLKPAEPNSTSGNSSFPAGMAVPAVRKRRVVLTTLSSGSDLVRPNAPPPPTTALEINTALSSEQSRTCTDDDDTKTPEPCHTSDHIVVTPVSASKRRVSFITLSEQPSPLVLSLDSTGSNGTSGPPTTIAAQSVGSDKSASVEILSTEIGTDAPTDNNSNERVH